MVLSVRLMMTIRFIITCADGVVAKLDVVDRLSAIGTVALLWIIFEREMGHSVHLSQEISHAKDHI